MKEKNTATTDANQSFNHKSPRTEVILLSLFPLESHTKLTAPRKKALEEELVQACLSKPSEIFKSTYHLSNEEGVLDLQAFLHWLEDYTQAKHAIFEAYDKYKVKAQPQDFLDISPPSPLWNMEQQPTEREIMDEQKISSEPEFADAADPVALGNAIRNARQSAHLSQSQLHKTTGISIRTISRLETGKGSAPLKTLEQIAEATGTKLKIGFDPN